MTTPLRVVQIGLGPIGIKMVQFITQRPSLKLVAAVDLNPNLIDKPLDSIVSLKIPLDINITDTLPAQGSADVAVITTTSSLEKCTPTILDAVSRRMSVVSTCEELSYPWLTHPELSKKIDAEAKTASVAVLSTGVNPGFLMDLLPIVLTGVCRSVDSITVERIQDAQHRRVPFQNKIGAGMTTDQFDTAKKAGTLRHVGLTESMHLIAARMGWPLSKTQDIIQPVIATAPFASKDQNISPGQCRGVNQTGRAFDKNNKEVITLRFIAAVGQTDTKDRVIITGDPSFESIIPNGVNGDIATCAITTNAITTTHNTNPGLHTMADIEPVTANK